MNYDAGQRFSKLIMANINYTAYFGNLFIGNVSNILL